MAILQAEHIAVFYTMRRENRRIQAITDVSFTVNSEEFVTVVGPSGCGKTTLLNSIAGLLSPSGGQITFDGARIEGPGKDRAMVFQTPALLPWRTVLRNVTFGLEIQGHDRQEAEVIAREFIDLVGLSGFEESFPHELSGGMQQRTNLARALSVRPKMLLFDEPLSSLDAQTREYMQLELQRIWMQRPTTTLYVTHQIGEAIFLADRVLVMTASPGKIKEVVPVDFPRPRQLKLQRTESFRRLEEHIWGILEVASGLEANPASRGRSSNG